MAKKKATSKKRVMVGRLTSEQNFQVWKWYEDHYSEIEEKRLTQEAAATQASTDLGLTLLPSNMQAAARATQKPWPKGQGQKGVRVTDNQFEALTQLVCHLYKELGVDIPDHIWGSL